MNLYQPTSNWAQNENENENGNESDESNNDNESVSLTTIKQWSEARGSGKKDEESV